MRMPISVLLTALVSATCAHAADLTKMERTIRKEPAYQTKSPKYCLLVFGPEAKLRVWLVQDGDTLCVDRNGNGDLTEDGEKVPAAKGEFIVDEEGVYTFNAGDIADGNLRHRKLYVSVSKLDHLAKEDAQVRAHVGKNPQARGYRIGAYVEMPGRQGAGVGGRVEQLAFLVDANGVLEFSAKPQDAPIIHFGGPFQITQFGRHQLTAGRETDFVLGVGTPGVGPGTTAYVHYQNLMPEDAHPRVEITYAPNGDGGTSVTELYELKRRC